MNQTEMLFNVEQEIMVQHQRDSCQQGRINAWAFKDAIDSATFMVDLPCKLRNGHPFLVYNGFD